MELRRLNSVQGISEGAWGLKNLVVLLLFSFSLIRSLFLSSLTHSFKVYQPWQTTTSSKHWVREECVHSDSNCSLFDTSVKCWVQLFSCSQQCLLLHVVWWQKFDLSGFFPFTCVNTAVLSPSSSPTTQNEICMHAHTVLSSLFSKTSHPLLLTAVLFQINLRSHPQPNSRSRVLEVHQRDVIQQEHKHFLKTYSDLFFNFTCIMNLLFWFHFLQWM